MRGAAVPTDSCFPATPGSSVSDFESEEFIDRDNGDDRGGAPKGLSRGPVRGVVAAALVTGAAAPGRALGTARAEVAAPRQPERRRCGWSHRVRAKSSRESGPGRQFASPRWMPLQETFSSPALQQQQQHLPLSSQAVSHRCKAALRRIALPHRGDRRGEQAPLGAHLSMPPVTVSSKMQTDERVRSVSQQSEVLRCVYSCNTASSS
ncbi:unnamed protein product [Lampetra fluviatilis]